MLSSNNLYSHLPLFLRRSVSQISESILPIGFKGKHWFQSMAYDLNSGLPITSSYFDQKYRNKLIKSNTNWSFEAEGIRKSRIIKNRDLLQRITRTDFENYLPEDVLVKVDRSSMLNSLEVRAPLLDYRIIEFAYGNVPSNLKTIINERKILFKKLG